MPALPPVQHGPQRTLDNLNAIFASVEEGIVMQSASGEIVECNASAERVLGLTRDQMMGRTSVDPRWRSVRVDGSDYPGTEHPAMVALATGTPVRNVIMGVHTPDNTLRWLQINSVPIIENDQAVRVVTTFTDVTSRRTAELQNERMRAELLETNCELRERQNVEKALTIQRERMALVLQASGIGHWDWNPVTDEAVFDERWVGMLGYELGEIEGSGARWLQLLHPDDLQGTIAAVEQHVQDRTPEHRAEFRMRHKDGGWVWILAVGRVIERDVTGQATRMVGVHVDISSRKAYEAALAEATAEAQRANRAKSDFLANMSHEIRTPMNGVIGAANLLHFTELSEEQRGYSDTIRHSGDILVSLIEDILDFSKIEAERLELERAPFDLQATIAEVVDLETARASNKGLDVIVDCRTHPDLRPEGDARRVRQVLLNLVSNAIKFTASGHITIAAEQKHSELRISVSDTGIGIPVDKQTLVFDKFMQADTSTTRQFGGTGLGLAISRRLVEAMGGTIGVDSAPGEGSTFWFTLPLPAGAQVNVSFEPQLTGASVLVVDENRSAREALAWLLTQHGASTIELADCGRAVELFRAATESSQRFDLVLVAQPIDSAELESFLLAIEHDPRMSSTAVIVTASARRRAHALRIVNGSDCCVMRMPVTRAADAIAQCASAMVKARGRQRQSGSLFHCDGALSSALDALPQAPVTSAERLRVLLVEDDEVSCYVGRRMLEKQGCVVDIAEDGLRAVTMTAARTFDLVFMDCNMPNMDGFEATRVIRSRGNDAVATDSQVPIVAITANALVGDRERCLAAGMVDYITKPLLVESVARALERWRPTTAAAAGTAPLDMASAR